MRAVTLWCPPNLDSLVRLPGDLPFTLWESGPHDPSAQALATVGNGRMRHHLPLEAVVCEPIADLNLHREHRGRRGGRVVRCWRLGLPLC
jgi:hypothetical protein